MSAKTALCIHQTGFMLNMQMINMANCVRIVIERFTHTFIVGLI